MYGMLNPSRQGGVHSCQTWWLRNLPFCLFLSRGGARMRTDGFLANLMYRRERTLEQGHPEAVGGNPKYSSARPRTSHVSPHAAPPDDRNADRRGTHSRYYCPWARGWEKCGNAIKCFSPLTQIIGMREGMRVRHPAFRGLTAAAPRPRDTPD